MLKTTNRKNYIMLTALALLCLGFISAFLLPAPKNLTPEKVNSSYHKTYTGFSKDTILSKTIISESGRIYKTEKDFISNKGHNYEIIYHVQKPNEKNIDISFLISASKNKIKTTISGLSHSEKISLKLNEKEVFNQVPADWSGKIILTSAYFNNKTKVCIHIFKENHGTRSICHNIKAKEDIT